MLRSFTAVLLVLLAACNGGGGASSSQSATSSSSARDPASAATSAGAGSSSAKHAPLPTPSAAGSTAPSASARAPSATLVAVEGGEIDANDLNDGVHHFTVEPFSMDVGEVSVAEYRACVTAGACKPPPDNPLQAGRCNYPRSDREDHPINCVPKDMAKAYCAWKSERLPTAAEWQLAAAGKEGRKYPWGDADPTPERACFKHPDGTCPVGTHASGKTPAGLMDMGGNVSEILLDDGCIGKPPAGTACLQPFVYTLGGAWNDLDRASVLSKNVSQVLVPETVGFRCVKPSSDKAPGLLP